MTHKKKNKKDRQIVKTKITMNPLIDPYYKNTFWTIVILVILLIFFIVTNTRHEPEHGPYPPGYKPVYVETRQTTK